MNKKITFLTLCLWLTAATFPVFAQQESDTTYTFRFMTEEDMFFAPWSGNGKELSRLLECVESNKTDILNGKMLLLVDGYCNSLGSEVENLATAKIRSNRVKSELITRQGLTEECFTTNNHATEGDYVTVRIVVSDKEIADAEARRRAEAERLEAEKRAEQERLAAERRKVEEDARLAAEKAAAEKAGADSLAAAQAEAESMAEAASSVEEKTSTANYTFSLRANLLRWATLTPDVGIEWRVSPSVGIVVNGTWTAWTWRDNHRRYGLWEVMPELRLYMGERKAWYMGAMFKTGQFNYNLNDNGRQGDLMGGGLTCGYQLQLSKALSMDFGLALGYLQTEYENYVVTNSVPECIEEGTQNWWGPINAGITLVWKLF